MDSKVKLLDVYFMVKNTNPAQALRLFTLAGEFDNPNQLIVGRNRVINFYLQGKNKSAGVVGNDGTA